MKPRLLGEKHFYYGNNENYFRDTCTQLNTRRTKITKALLGS